MKKTKELKSKFKTKAPVNEVPEEMFEDLADEQKAKYWDSPLFKRMRKAMHMESAGKLTSDFVLNESLFEQVELINEADYSIGMKDSPVFGKNAKKPFNPKVETWILIKLYEACIDPGTTCNRIIDLKPEAVGADWVDPDTGEIMGTKAITRSELLARVGTALDAPSQSQTYFNYFRELDLAYAVTEGGEKVVYPGPYLKGWIEGKVDVETRSTTSPDLKAELSRYPNPISGPGSGAWPLKKWVGEDDVAKRTPTAPHVAKDAGTAYEYDFDDLKAELEKDEVSKSDLKKMIDDAPVVEPETKPEVPSIFDTELSEPDTIKKKAGVKIVPLDMFEALDPENPEDDYAFIRDYDYRMDEEYKAAYRECAGLDAKAEINEDNFSEGIFNNVSCVYGWNPERARDGILRR